MNSMHFLGEWFDCCASLAAMRDPAAIRSLCIEHVIRHRLTIIHDDFVASMDDGVVGRVVAENLQLVVRTYPERDCVSVNLYAGRELEPDMATVFRLLTDLCEDFRPTHTTLHRVRQASPAPHPNRTPIAPTHAFAMGRRQAA